MTSHKDLLAEFVPTLEGTFIFGDGNKGQIKGKCVLIMEGLSMLKDVLYVEGLKANLISIS